MTTEPINRIPYEVSVPSGKQKAHCLRHRLRSQNDGGKAAEACADSENVQKGIEIALDIEQLIYEVNTFLNAANMINRLGKD